MVLGLRFYSNGLRASHVTKSWWFSPFGAWTLSAPHNKDVKHHMKMSQSVYIENSRKRAVEIASGMLDGSVHYLEGAIELSSLRFEVGLPEDDCDFIAFTGVASEVDHLPIGAPRQYWSKEALEKHEPEIQQSIKWAKEVSLSECKSLVARFSA